MARRGDVLDWPLDAMLHVRWHRLDLASHRDVREPKKGRPTHSHDYRRRWRSHGLRLLDRNVLWHY
jgi:hypothetical protein